MRLEIKLVPRARKSGVFPQSGFLKVKVLSPPVQNRANRAMLSLLSKYFGIPERDIRLLSGSHSTRKVVLIEEKNDERIKKVLCDDKAYNMA